MIVGGDRDAVISNIQRCAESGDFNCKVETNDPVLTSEQDRDIINQYLENQSSFNFHAKTCLAMAVTDVVTRKINKNTEVVGLEKLPKDIQGMMITSNHFGPLENTVIRYFAGRYLHKKLSVICQTSNYAMTGFIGFFMNYARTIPISTNPRYLARNFPAILKEKIIDKNECVLIYPEQEMWFNYKKPRPPKNGAYFYSAKLNFPILSCFVEMIDKNEPENDEFNKVDYRLHVLGVLYPDKNKTTSENIEELAKKDYDMKRACYETVYGKPLDYTFSPSDIAGYKKGL